MESKVSSNESLFSFIRDGFVIIAIAGLLPVTVHQIHEIAFPAPRFEAIVTVTQEKDKALYDQQVAQFQAKDKSNKRNACLVHSIVGLILLFAGFFIRVVSIATSIILGGVFNTILGITIFSSSLDNAIRLILLLITTTLMLGLLYKLAKRPDPSLLDK